jgi:signal transduction histidine kinase
MIDQRFSEAGVVSSQSPLSNLGPLYVEALASHLARADERTLRYAYELGRYANSNRVGVLEIARIHHEALASRRIRGSRAHSFNRTLRRAGEFLAEALSSYEMANRGVHDAIAALRRLNEMMEGEIQRIAHAVHDEAGQLLDAARLVMSGIGSDVGPNARERLKQVGSILDDAETKLRQLSHELRPIVLDDLGLAPALEFLADGFSKRTRLAVTFQSSLDHRLPARVETAVYRIVQEALANVARHSRAAKVEIRLALNRGGTLQCSVADDGIGFAVSCARQKKGLGLVAIRERLNAVGGTLEIHSAPGRGAELRVAIPLEQ